MDTVHLLIYETCILYNYMTTFIAQQFLADRTNGRAYATVLRLSVCRLSVCLWRYVLWLNGAS